MYLVTSLSLPGFRALIYADIRCSANRVRTECVCALLTRARGTCVIYIISVCVIYVVSGITGRQQTTGHQTLGPPWQAHRSSSSAAPSRLRVERPDPRAVCVCVCVCERWGCGKGRRARGHLRGEMRKQRHVGGMPSNRAMSRLCRWRVRRPCARVFSSSKRSF